MTAPAGGARGAADPAGHPEGLHPAGESGGVEAALPPIGGESVRAALTKAGPLALAGLLTNGTNVVVTILLARLLTTRGYGALNQLNGLFLVVSMPGSAVVVAVVRRLASSAADPVSSVVQRWARRLHRRGIGVAAGLTAVVVSVGAWLAGLLRQPSTVGLEAMLVAGFVWVLLCLDRGLLQAARNYRSLSANLLVEGAMRATAILVLVGAGLGVTGAACGILVAELVTAVHARRSAHRCWAPRAGASGPTATVLGALPPPAPRRQRRILVTDLLGALVALATLAWLQNVDVIVIGREAPRAAGAYAAVSVASKALVLGAIVLGGYLLPEAAVRWRAGSHALRPLAVTLLLLAAPAAALLSVAAAAPGLLIRFVFSARYLSAERAFAPLVLAMACLSVSVVLTMYLLAVGRRRVAGFLLVGAVAATASVAAAHGSPLATAHADLVVQGGLALALVSDFASVHRRHLR